MPPKITTAKKLIDFSVVITSGPGEACYQSLGT
jgi:hypothetical protein